jgi:hypothetical protein
MLDQDVLRCEKLIQQHHLNPQDAEILRRMVELSADLYDPSKVEMHKREFRPKPAYRKQLDQTIEELQQLQNSSPRVNKVLGEYLRWVSEDAENHIKIGDDLPPPSTLV